MINSSLRGTNLEIERKLTGKSNLQVLISYRRHSMVWQCIKMPTLASVSCILMNWGSKCCNQLTRWSAVVTIVLIGSTLLKQIILLLTMSWTLTNQLQERQWGNSKWLDKETFLQTGKWLILPILVKVGRGHLSSGVYPLTILRSFLCIQGWKVHKASVLIIMENDLNREIITH